MTETAVAPKLDFSKLPHQAMAEGEQPPFIAMVDCNVSIHGIFAETCMTVTLFNPNQRDFEGDLVVPLPSTAVLCGHSLDINGRMREAVIVGKKEGRQILEAEIRKNVDPGLVEKVQGNVHRIRVYPLPSLGWRTVSVTWISELKLTRNRVSFHLPMGYLQEVDESTLEVELHDVDQEPEISGGQGELRFTLRKENNFWKANAKMSKGIRVDDLCIQLPEVQSQQAVFIEQDATGEQFFCISQSSPETSMTKPWQPARLAIAWDSSGSRTDTAKELELLTSLCRQWQELTIDLVVFRNGIDSTEQQIFTISNGDSSQLVNTLKGLACDGATNFAVLDLSSLPHPEIEAWLLFSDGMATSGNGYPDSSPVPVHTVTSQVMANSFLLARIAEQCGGNSYNLLEQSVGDACTALLANRQPVQVVASKGCEAVQIKNRGNHTTIIGRLASDDGLIRLQEKGRVHEFLLSADRAVSACNIARLWACDEAEEKYLLEKNSEAATAIGRRYGVVTSGTSLLVLDTLEQYLEYDVEPPKSEQKLLGDYTTRKKSVEDRLGEQQQEHLDSVHDKWQEMISWWQKDFFFKEEDIEQGPGIAGDDDVMYGGIAMSSEDVGEDVASPALYSLEEGLEEAADVGSIEVCSISRDFTARRRRHSVPEPDSAPYARSEKNRAGIAVRQWTSDMPYLKELEQAKPENRYKVYLRLRAEYASAPSFYLDCGDYFIKNKMQAIGVRILSNLLEMELENPALMRTCAYRQQQAGELDAAIAVFTDILTMRDDEPQSHRDLGLALGERWQRDKQEQDLFAAMLHLWSVVAKNWDRFPEIEMIALLELNRFIRLAEKNDIEIPERIEQRLRKTLDLDLRISMAWDADLTDVDLHVLEPTGDHASYSQRTTRQGARVSRDVQDGYGPEEYILKKAVKGAYQIKAHYYASSQQTLCGPCTVMVTLFTDYAREDEKQQSLILRLDKTGEEFVVGEVMIG